MMNNGKRSIAVNAPFISYHIDLNPPGQRFPMSSSFAELANLAESEGGQVMIDSHTDQKEAAGVVDLGGHAFGDNHGENCLREIGLILSLRLECGRCQH